MRLRDSIRRLMAGRNGLDSLFYFCFVLYLVLYGFNFIFQSPYLYYAQLIILIIALFRMFSRNIPRRQKENAAFNKVMKTIFPNFDMTKRRLLEGRTHAFHECPNCKAVLRFQRKKGKYKVKCPRCGHEFTIKNRF